MKFTEFTHKFKGKGKFSLYIISGNEYFLKKQALTEIKKHFFLEGGTEQGFIKFDNKDTGTNFLSEEIEKNSAKKCQEFYIII